MSTIGLGQSIYEKGYKIGYEKGWKEGLRLAQQEIMQEEEELLKQLVSTGMLTEEQARQLSAK